MNGRFRLAPALALTLPLLLLGVAAASAQPAAPVSFGHGFDDGQPTASGSTGAEEPLPRWDTFGFIGWRGARYESNYYSDQWDARFSYGGTAGYYWTANLKLEIDVSATTPSRFSEYEQRPIEGQAYPAFIRSEHHVSTASLGGLVIYQFFENASFHPYLGAGAGLITSRDRITTERQTQTIRPTPNGPYVDILIAEASTRSRTDHHGRGLIVAGFKAYPSERVFFRTDVQWSTGSTTNRDITWRLGVGVDF